MNLLTSLPACPKCRTEIPLADLNRSAFNACPGCEAQIRADAFAALFRPPSKASSGELVMTEGESACFYHESKKAVVVCDACGRFLCGLCDCLVHGKHLCPNCLETGKQKKTIETLDTVRPLYGYQAMVFAVLPLLFTGPIAIFVALRHWKAPGSIVSRNQRWQMPVALALGSLQTLGLIAAIYAMFRK